MEVDSTACHPDGNIEGCSRAKDVQDSLLTCSDALTLPSSDLLGPYAAFYLLSIGNISGTAAVIGILKIV